MKLLSIIVPGYNIAKTLSDLMATVLIDSFVDKLEIIIVNDGSSDETSIIAHQYEKQYPECVIVVDKENGGHGSTINRGIRIASGKYIQVIDGDDWVNTDNFAKLLEKLEEINSDLVLSPWTAYYINKNSYEDKQIDYDHSVLKQNREYYLDDVINHIGNIGMVSIIYKTSIFRDNSIIIDENVFYDDNEFVVYPLRYVSTVMILEPPIYVYRLGQPTQSVAPQNYWKRRIDHKIVVQNIVRFFNKSFDSMNLGKYYEWFITKIVIGHYYIYINYGPATREAVSELREFDNWLKINNSKLYSNVKARKIRLLRALHFRFYRIIMLLPK